MIPRLRSSAPGVTLIGALVALTVPSPGAAQDDVEMLGARYGTRPPTAYYEAKARNPDAFTFQRAWKARNPRLERPPFMEEGAMEWRVRPAREVESGAAEGVMGLAAGSRASAVTGTFRVPLVLGSFFGSSESFDREEIQAWFFDGPNPTGTIPEYYDEVSGGRIDFVGETHDWVHSHLTELETTNGTSGLAGSRIGEWIVSLLAELDHVDWGRYDNDGPDGVPNSGDDDGFVDVLAVMHPNYGAECGGSGRDDRIWSHKWTISSAFDGEPFVTSSASANGGMIRVDDYTVQPAQSCLSQGSPVTQINEIGVLAHELGHGFGLPDLYDTSDRNRHQGIGTWGLMGSGSWGCSNNRPSRPCHMSAWSKAQLGWVDVEPLPVDADLGSFTFEPVQASGKVYRLDGPPGSEEYLLLENRQRTGFDGDLHAPGLLVWHVDDARVQARWPINTINNDGDHMGVFLLQADGENELGTPGFDGNRGDAGDPFPGSLGVDALHAGTDPWTRTWEGAAFGLTLTEIAPSGGEVLARTRTTLLDLTVRGEGDDAGSATLAVDGVEAAGGALTVTSAPFMEHAVEAGAGGLVEEGVRVGFQGWDDDPDAGRTRTVTLGEADRTLVARYGGREVRVGLTVEGEVFGVTPGTVELSPIPVEPDEDGALWVLADEETEFRAVPTTGFDFTAWTGFLAGEPNPVTVTLSEPGALGAVFDLTYGVGGEATREIEAAREHELVLEAENGTAPVTWTLQEGRLPEGLTFATTGRISGAPLVDGTFPVTVRAVDARGLAASARLTLEVVPPALSASTLTAPFLLTGAPLTAPEQLYLDRKGNGNGSYDVGDFRAFLLANPDLPETATASQRAPLRTVVPLVRFQDGGNDRDRGGAGDAGRDGGSGGGPAPGAAGGGR